MSPSGVFGKGVQRRYRDEREQKAALRPAGRRHGGTDGGRGGDGGACVQAHIACREGMPVWDTLDNV